MKFKIVYTLFGVLLLAVLFMGSSGGRATAADSGNTGAPGDSGPTCVTCHGTNADIGVELDIAIEDMDGNPIAKYVPGEVYNGSVTLTTTMGMPVANGFQIVALKAALDEDGESTNSFSAPGDNVQIKTITSGRQYAEHNGPSMNNNVFTFKWTAPEAASGPVTFYSCGNGVNLNGSTSGDNAACNTLELLERPISTTDLGRDVQLTVAPNPVADQLNLNLNSSLTGTFQARLFDVAGRQWLSRDLELNGGSNSFNFEASGLPAGVYFLQLTNGTRSTAMRVVKR